MALPPGQQKMSDKKGAPKRPKAPTKDSQMAAATMRAFNQFIRQLGMYNQGWGASLGQANRLFPNQLGPMYTPQQLRNQAQSAIKALYGPQFQNITNRFQRQGELGARNITGYTGTYMNRLGAIAPAIRTSNAQAQQAQAAVGGALADYMRNTGSELTGQLTSKLADAHLSEGQLAATAGLPTETGVLGSGQIAGMNAASLMRMSSEGNAWENWASALPGLGALQGQAQLGQFMGQLNEGFLQAMESAQSSMSEAGLNLYQTLLDRDLQRRQLGMQNNQARADYLANAKQMALNASLGGAGLMQNWANMLLDRELGYLNAANDQYATQAGIYGNELSASQPPGPGEPGYVMPPQEAMRDLVSKGVAGFPAFARDPLTQKPSGGYPTMQKRVMGWLRGAAAGYNLTEAQLKSVRDSILRALGWFPGKQRPPTTSPPPGTVGNPGDSADVNREDTTYYPGATITGPGGARITLPTPSWWPFDWGW